MAHQESLGPTPFQTPSTMKVAAGLSGDNEYACIWTGQSQSRPWGLAEDAYEFSEWLRLSRTGVDISGLVIPDEAGYSAPREVGMVEVLSVPAGTVSFDGEWNNGGVYLRLGSKTAPLKGYALVRNSFAAPTNTIHVEWIVLPANDRTVTNSYLVREDRKYHSYERARCLTAYLPVQDIVPPYENHADDDWDTPNDAPYPAANGLLSAEGRRLILPAPTYDLGLTTIASFSDLGLFLPLTRREGATGFGISEIADSTFLGPGPTPPTGHPIIDITGNVFTFLNALTAPPINIPFGPPDESVDVLKQAYVLVDWEQGGQSKRSWGIVASNTATDFTVTGAWLGDGAPIHPPEELVGTVSFTNATPGVVNWAGHSLVEGDRVTFHTLASGTLPAQITLGRVYRVRNPNPGAGTFQISESMDHPVLTFSGGSSPMVTGIQAWIYTVWIPHWADNPYTWLPGPEFAYPNEDAMPAAPFVHFRARGQPYYAHQEILGAGPKASVPFDGVAEGRFGAVLPFAMRMALGIGKRVNMVILGVSGAPLSGVDRISSTGTHNGTIGWWNHVQFGFSVALEDSSSFLAQRVKRLITYIAHQALLAESNSKPMRFISACHVQSQTDSVLNDPREMYVAMLTDYKRWLRDLVRDGGWSPYDTEAEMPVLWPLQTHFPWETTGVTGQDTYQAFGIDIFGEMNNLIREQQTADEFGDYILVEDMPKLATDFAHWSGQGMAILGARLSTAALGLIEHALGYGSTALLSNSRLLRIANLALSRIGQNARQITSLTENTAQARAVRNFLPEAIRQLLSLRQWSWAIRMIPATQVQHDRQDWEYAYVVPGAALSVVEIVPPSEETNSSGAGTSGESAVVIPGVSMITATDVRALEPSHQPEPFEIGRSPSGHQLLFTNVAEIGGDVTVPYVIDGELHPERLPTRPKIRFVEKVLDPDRMSPSFATALSWYLASDLAASLIKGDRGAAVSAYCKGEADKFLRQEAIHESVTREVPVRHLPPWMAKR